MGLYQHLEKIKNVSEVSKYGSINQASKRLGLAQPTLSTSIKTIENQLGCQLFTRTSKGVVPTDAGKILTEFAEELKKLTQRIEAQLLGIDTSIEFPLHIAAPESISIYLMPYFIKHLKSCYPNLSLVFKTGSQEKSLSWLDSSNVDIAFTSTQTKKPKYESETFFSDALSFYCLPSLVDTYRKQPLIIRDDLLEQASDKEKSFLLKTFKKFAAPIECENDETIKALAEQGLGIALLPNFVAKQSLTHGRLSLLNTNLTPANNVQHRICLTLLKERSNEHTIKLILAELTRFFGAWKMNPVKLPQK